MNKYLAATIIGTLIPNIFVIQESIQSGNYMHYTHPLDTISTMFANPIVSAFSSDLLVLVIFFMIWSFNEAKKLNIKQVYWCWIYTFVLGLAGGLPLFLYFKHQADSRINNE